MEISLDIFPFPSTSQKRRPRQMLEAASTRALIDSQKKEDTMSNNFQYRHFLDRIADVAFNLKRNLREQFHMDDDAEPINYVEAVERIQAGKFTIVKNSAGEPSYVKWRAPDAPQADRPGYEKAKEALIIARRAADDALVATANLPAEMLAILNKFQAWTYAPATA